MPALRHFLTFLLLVCVPGLTAARGHFRYTPACAAAYNSLLALQQAEGHAALKQALEEDPDNLLAVYISDYEDFFLLLLNGDPAQFESRKSNLDERLRRLDRADPGDPYYRLCKSGIYLHWAILHGRFGDYFKAALTFRKSYVLIRENRNLFPTFAPNDVFYGLGEAVAGTVPDEYKWLATMLGIKGDVNRGISRLVGYINAHPTRDAFLRAEAVISWCYLKFYLQSQKEYVWKYVNSNQFAVRDNLLQAFVKANIALNYRKADIALQTLRDAQTLPDYGSFPVMDYEMGSALFLKSDPACLPYLQRFVQQCRGRLYVKDAWQKMALIWHLQHQAEKAASCRSQILKAGNRQTDADRQAQRFAESGAWPRPGLLRARLLCDGGYYKQAMETLQAIDRSQINNGADSAEYFFRTGRIQDELGEDKQALDAYQAAIQAGRNRKEHFAARAALQMGLIYEQQGNVREASVRFRECLSMRNHDFQSSIDQQARAGLNRLGKQ